MTQNRMVHSRTGRLQKIGKSWQEVAKKRYGKLEEIGDILLMTHVRQTGCVCVVVFCFITVFPHR